MIYALFVGLILGGLGYRWFLLPAYVETAYRTAIAQAAVDIKAWLASCEPELRQAIEQSMDCYNLDRATARLMAQIEAQDVAAKRRKK